MVTVPLDGPVRLEELGTNQSQVNEDDECKESRHE